MNLIFDKYSVFLQTLFLLLFGSFLIYSLPLDPDLGWHLAYGKHFVETGQILKDNTFSYVMTDYKWANSYWISEVILYLINLIFGFENISLVLGFVYCLFVIYFFRNSHFLTKFLIIFCTTILMSNYYVTVRPIFFSCIFLLLLISTLLKGTRSIYFLPILFFLWANFHADFVLGMFIFFAYLVNTFFFAKEKFKETFVVFILSGLATAINPYGLDLWWTLLKENNAFQFYNISEWLPFEDRTPTQIFYTVLAGILLGVSFLSVNKFGYWYIFLCLFFYILGFRSVYFLRIFIFLSVFSFVNVESFLKQNNFNIKHKYINLFIGSVLFLMFVSAFQKFDLGYSKTSSLYNLYQSGNLPIGAVQYIRENSISDRIVNNYNWGGFLIWNLPEHKTFIDGRMASWKTESHHIFFDYISFYREPEKNMDKFDYYVSQYKPKYVLENKDSKLAKYLIEIRGKKIIYEDSVSYLILL